MPHTPARAVRRSLLVASLAALALGTFATGAFAETGTPNTAGDDRAVYHGSKDDRNATTCAEAGLSGDTVSLGDTSRITASVDGSNTYVTVTGIPAGETLVGVVVKGSDAYNVYLPGKFSGLPWSELHSPINNGGNVPTISHWFACVSGTPTTTTTTAPATTTTAATSTKPGSSSTATTSSTPGGSVSGTSAPSSVGGVQVTNSSAPAVANADTNNLAYTGFGSAWLIVLAAVLLVGGAVVLSLPKLRAALRRRG